MKYFNSYRGIVVQNDDPEKMGRVKVFVPQVNMTLYDGWNNDRDTDKKFTSLGGNLNSSITPELLQRMKESLPWAQVKLPIMGMGTGLTYHNDLDFSEKSNDSDASKQQTVTNKQNQCSLPENNTSSLASAISNVAISPTNSAEKINNALSTPTLPAYIQNATASEDSLTASASATANASTTVAKNNIAEIVINFIPNSRNANNLNRRFTTSATISDATTSTTASGASSTASNASTGYSAPITYNTVQSNPNDFVAVTFVPNSRNAKNLNRNFSTSASIVSYDGTNITVADKAGASQNTVISKDSITNISVNHTSDFNNSELTDSNKTGELSKLFSEYSSNVSGVSNSPTSPPSTINSAGCNAGGGGSSLLALSTFSNLMPFNVFLATLIGNSNPDSKQGINYKRKITNGTDPKERVGSNQQTSADGLGPMRSEDQNNKVKGAIAIPAVGAHVGVYFENGNPLFPIIDGVFYSKEDFEGIHDVAK